MLLNIITRVSTEVWIWSGNTITSVVLALAKRCCLLGLFIASITLSNLFIPLVIALVCCLVFTVLGVAVVIFAAAGVTFTWFAGLAAPAGKSGGENGLVALDPAVCALGDPADTGEANRSWTGCWVPGGGVLRELWSLWGLDPKGGGMSWKVTTLFFLKVISISLDDCVGDVRPDGPKVAS